MVFEPVVALLEVLPEGVPLGVGGLLQAFFGHAEGEEVDAEKRLAVSVGGGAEGEDFLDLFIGHGKAADGNLVAVDHDVAAGAAVGAVVGIWETEVEGEVVFAVRLHGGGRHGVEAFGDLQVALGEFRPEAAGGGDDGIGAEQVEFSSLAVAEEELELAFFLEGADEDGIAEFQAGFGEVAFEPRQDAGCGCGGPWGFALGEAGKREAGGDDE